MQDQTFNALADLALTQSGLSIPSSKAYLVQARLAPILRREGFASCDDLVACLKARPNPVFEAEIVAALQNGQTWFFRERETLHLLAGEILPRLLKLSKSGRVRIWCAGAGSGQEAYSLAILLAEHEASLRGARIEIVASDLSRTQVAKAKTGRFGHFEIQNGLSVHRMMEHFTQQETGEWEASEALRKSITFRVQNLLKEDAAMAPADIILCRHVLSGMSRSMRRVAAEYLSQQVLPGGFLLLGHGESLSGVSPAFEPSRRHRGAWEVVPVSRRKAA